MKRGDGQTSRLMVMPLGSGQEVGRSCHLVEFKGKRILLDMGIHPGKRYPDTLPYFDRIGDLATIDLLLISHFHLDHVASLPYFMQKTRFKGRVFMTHPTHAITELLLRDYVRVSSQGRKEGDPQLGRSETEGLYDDKDVQACLKRCEKIDFEQQIEVDGIRFTAYNAGHVLGACQYLIEIAGVRILYTGDFSREDDRHLMSAACNPDWRPDVLIVESTFGVQIHPSPREREQQFVRAIEAIVRRGGKCLIPVFSLGRAQELLLILEEHWAKTPELQRIPIFHASKLAEMSLKVFRRYINAMNDRIRKLNDISNPWDLHYVVNSESMDNLNQPGPAVVLASPGMLQNGTSRRLFEQWCPDARNGVIIAGYCVEGTLAKDILSHPTEITTLEGRRKPLSCEVRYISFTAHSDYRGTSSYIEELRPRHTVLVHGEHTEMFRLYDELKRQFAGQEMDFFTPANEESIFFDFHEEKVVKMLGRLADKRVRFEDAPVFGFLVSGGFDDKLVAPDELQAFTPLSTTLIAQRLHVPFHSRFERLKAFVGKLFEVEEVQDTTVSAAASLALANVGLVQKHSLKVLDEILLTHSYPPGEVLMEWRASPINDMIADSIVALLMQAEGGVSGVRISSCFHHHHHRPHHHHPYGDEAHESKDVVAGDEDDSISGENVFDKEDDGPRTNDEVATLVKLVLEERYGQEFVKISEDSTAIELEMEDGSKHSVLVNSLECMSENPEMKRDLERCVLNAKRALLPIGLQLRESDALQEQKPNKPGIDDDLGECVLETTTTTPSPASTS